MQRKMLSDDGFVDSSIYKTLFELLNLTPSSIITLLVYPALENEWIESRVESN